MKHDSDPSEHVFSARVQWRCALHPSSQAFICSAMETHFLKLLTEFLFWCCFQRQFGTLLWVMQQIQTGDPFIIFLCTTSLSAQWPWSEFVWSTTLWLSCCCPLDADNSTIIAFTIDCDRPSRAKKSINFHLKSLSSSAWAALLPEICLWIPWDVLVFRMKHLTPIISRGLLAIWCNFTFSCMHSYVCFMRVSSAVRI